jgi:hypothetical protein
MFRNHLNPASRLGISGGILVYLTPLMCLYGVDTGSFTFTATLTCSVRQKKKEEKEEDKYNYGS